jgi:hypothetical protein
MTRAKVIFLLERDEDGYPPVDAEGLWADLLDEQRASIDNIPFFVRDATVGDIVRYANFGGELRYVSTIQRSPNSLVRVICYPHADPERVRERIAGFGCETEFDANHRLIAVNVPLDGDLDGLREYLKHEEEIGMVGYEEPILTR